MRREFERKEQERKKSQKLEFTPGGVQPGNALPTPKINIPTPGTRLTLQHITLLNTACGLHSCVSLSSKD